MSKFLDDLFDDPEQDEELEWCVGQGLALHPDEHLIQATWTKHGWRKAHHRRVRKGKTND
jgi:hypothetical protein